MIRILDRAGVGLTVLLPFVLLHGRGVASVVVGLIAAMFLVRSALLRDWRWVRTWWVVAALIWWGWLVLCSVRSGTAGEALLVVRFLLLTAALEGWLLRDVAMRTWLGRLLRWSAFYIAAQSLLQFAVGTNLFGMPRSPDGELTGPYDKPRAGPPLAQLLYPAMLPLAATRLRALLVLSGGIAVMVLIGQRMPLLLSFLGLLVTALMLPRLRGPVLATALAAGLLLAALPVISPPAAQRIETKFARQMRDWPQSPYGKIAARAVAMVRAHPLAGTGFDGFRYHCEEPAYFQGWHGDGGGGAAICVQHPHNYYLQAAVEGGLPGLAAFVALALCWLRAISRGLGRAPERLRVGLFVAAVIQLWPIASSTDWVSMPLAGWFSLQLGLALALARPYMPGRQISFEA